MGLPRRQGRLPKNGGEAFTFRRNPHIGRMFQQLKTAHDLLTNPSVSEHPFPADPTDIRICCPGNFQFSPVRPVQHPSQMFGELFFRGFDGQSIFLFGHTDNTLLGVLGKRLVFFILQDLI